MEWFVVLAPVLHGTVEFRVGGVAAFVATLLVAGVPALLVLRHTLGLEPAVPSARQLRVIEGGKEPRRQAA